MRLLPLMVGDLNDRLRGPKASMSDDQIFFDPSEYISDEDARFVDHCTQHGSF